VNPISKAMSGVIPPRVQFIVILTILFVFMWFWITPVFEYLRDILKLPPFVQILIGIMGVFIIIKRWKFHPW